MAEGAVSNLGLCLLQQEDGSRFMHFFDPLPEEARGLLNYATVQVCPACAYEAFKGVALPGFAQGGAGGIPAMRALIALAEAQQREELQ